VVDEGQPRTVGVILAGGAGSRIGGAKALRMLGDKPLIAHVIDRIAPQIDAVWISTRDNAASLQGFGTPIVEDTRPDVPGGALAAIIAGLEAAEASGFDYVVTVPCDVPFLPGDLVGRLRERLMATGGHYVVVSAGGRLQPTIGLWSPIALNQLVVAFDLGERRLGRVCREIGAAVLDANDAGWPPQAFLNVNTPVDFAEALGHLNNSLATHP
jgi:molybdopterin-guanine dinucleotide biosynthesis protein A